MAVIAVLLIPDLSLVGIGEGLRSEYCGASDGSCMDFWVRADEVAVGITVAALLVAALFGKHRTLALLIATVAVVVPTISFVAQ